MSKADCFVSIITPAHNAERTIEATLDSVLRQSHEDFELVVVDDGSRDATADIVGRCCERDRRVRLLQQANAGVAAARNHGIAHSKGELVAVLDADDTWTPDKLARQVQRLQEAGPDTGLVYCWFWVVDDNGRRIGPGYPVRFEGDVLPYLIPLNFIRNCSSALIRRRCIEEAGGFDPSLRARGAQGCEDISLFLRIAERHRFAVVPDFLTNYRHTPDSMSRNIGQQMRSHQLVMDALRLRRPDLPSRLFRIAEANNAFWLARRALSSGQFGTAAKLTALMLRSSPEFVAGPIVLGALRRAASTKGQRRIEQWSEDFEQVSLWLEQAVRGSMTGIERPIETG